MLATDKINHELASFLNHLRKAQKKTSASKIFSHFLEIQALLNGVSKLGLDHNLTTIQDKYSR